MRVDAAMGVALLLLATAAPGCGTGKVDFECSCETNCDGETDETPTETECLREEREPAEIADDLVDDCTETLQAYCYVGTCECTCTRTADPC